MAYHNTGDEHIYADAAREKTFKVKVGEEPPAEAAVLLVAAGDSLSDEAAEQYGLTDQLDTAPAKAPSALEREKAGLEAAVARRSFEEARVRRATIADLEAREAAAKTTTRVAGAEGGRTVPRQGKGE